MFDIEAEDYYFKSLYLFIPGNYIVSMGLGLCYPVEPTNLMLADRA